MSCVTACNLSSVTSSRSDGAVRVSAPLQYGGAALGWLLGLGLTLRYLWVTWGRRMDVNSTHPYSNEVMSDFRDTVVLPHVALRAGINPYDVDAYQAVAAHAQTFNPYAPWWLSATSAFSEMPWDVATFWWLVTLSGCMLIAAILASSWGPGSGWLRVFLVGGWMISWLWLWRPISLAFGLGNIGAVVAMATALAFLLPGTGWGIVAVAVAWIKPQFGVPLGVIMLLVPQLRSRYLWGTLLAGLASLPQLVSLVMVAGGVRPLVDSVLGNAVGESAHGDMFGRIDVGGVLDLFGWKVSGLVSVALGVLLLVVSARYWRHGVQPAWVWRRALALVCVVLISFPHYHYDLAAVGLLLPGAVVEGVVRHQGRARWAWAGSLAAIGVLCLLPGSILPDRGLAFVFLVATWLAAVVLWVGVLRGHGGQVKQQPDVPHPAAPAGL